jgi:hypothetical protein
VDDTQGGAVKVAGFVGVVQAAQGIRQDAQDDGEGDLAASFVSCTTDGLQRLAFDVLHRDEGCAAVLLDLHGVDDVRVVEACGEASLVEEHGLEVRVEGEVRLEAFDDAQLDEASGAAHDGQVHLCHAALPELGEQVVRPDRSWTEVVRRFHRLPTEGSEPRDDLDHPWHPCGHVTVAKWVRQDGSGHTTRSHSAYLCFTPGVRAQRKPR